MTLPKPFQAELRLAARSKQDLGPKRAQKTIKDLVRLLRTHPQIVALFERFGVAIDHLEQIPIKFKEMDVSAKAKNGVIFLNNRLLDDGDIVSDLPYVVHEIVHILQQISGRAADYGDLSECLNYLDNPLEEEAFGEQIRFIKDFQGENEAKEYLNGLLDFHELDGNERSKKYDLLWN